MGNLDYLNWRYAVKKFDVSKKISPIDLDDILETLRLAPSSFGLQAWKFLVIENQEKRKPLAAHCWGQNQVWEASHLIVLCTYRQLTNSYIADYVSFTAQERNTPRENLAGLEKMITGFTTKMSAEEVCAWLKHQVYLALGFLMAECARRGIDTCPMEGFDAKKIDEALGLEKENLQSVVLCPIGYRASDDKYAGMKKVRFPKDSVISQR